MVRDHDVKENGPDIKGVDNQTIVRPRVQNVFVMTVLMDCPGVGVRAVINDSGRSRQILSTKKIELNYRLKHDLLSKTHLNIKTDNLTGGEKVYFLNLLLAPGLTHIYNQFIIFFIGPNQLKNYQNGSQIVRH